jgi:hypothetical protein
MYIAKVPAANMTVVTDDTSTAVIDHESGNHATFTAHGSDFAQQIHATYCKGLDSDPIFAYRIKKQIDDAWQ